MYIPDHFAVTDPELLYPLMQRFNFATLVTVRADCPVATHLPLVVVPPSDGQPHGTLVGHVARANPQWHEFDGAEALVMFQGDHAYISPSWYEKHPSVPTWNYVAIHAYGVPRRIDEEQRVRAALRDLVALHEIGRPQPWDMDSLDDAYLRSMMRGVVVFEMEINRLEGKAKLSQNRSLADRQGVIAALLSSADPLQQALAAHIQALGDTTP